MINSRSITYVGTKTEEPIPLTPAHFTIGKRISSLPTCRQRKGSNSAETVLRHHCRVRPSIDLLKNGSWEPLHEWQHMWLQDVMDIPLGCHGATDQY
ncbi:hypothetical protein TNCV_3597091 [Trichonephila clavipes]|nr:hypothetical protein TNCV_3597091 [Trichonephila clavipes]